MPMREVNISPAILIPCIVCEATGICLRCKGFGRAGYFLRLPPVSAAPCQHCKGSGRCSTCRGTAAVTRRSFDPEIRVVTSQQRPTSITVAAATGGYGGTFPFPGRSFSGEPRVKEVGWRGGCRPTTGVTWENSFCLARSSGTRG